MEEGGTERTAQMERGQMEGWNINHGEKDLDQTGVEQRWIKERMV